MIRIAGILTCVTIVALAGCTRPVDLVSTSRDSGTPLTDAADGAAANAVEPDGATTTPPGAGPTVRCTSAAHVFVLATSGDLFAFDPVTDAVTKLGPLACPDNPKATPLAIATSDEGLLYLLTDDGLITMRDPFTTSACKQWQKAPALPTSANGAAFTVSSGASAFYAGIDRGLFRTTSTTPFATWTSSGSIATADHFRALLGTGDGRLFAVVAPGTKAEYRVTSIDPSTAITGATILVPTVYGQDPEAPAGFALWGSTLLVFGIKALVRYDFASGTIASPEIVPDFTTPLLAAASPPCASAL